MGYCSGCCSGFTSWTLRGPPLGEVAGFGNVGQAQCIAGAIEDLVRMVEQAIDETI